MMAALAVLCGLLVAALRSAGTEGIPGGSRAESGRARRFPGHAELGAGGRTLETGVGFGGSVLGPGLRPKVGGG